jgi:hypothetical protein
MFGEQRTRTLLGPADPARTTAVAPPRLSAHDLINLAEATTEPVIRRFNARPTRRLALAAGTLAMAAAVSAVVHTFDTFTLDRSKIASPPDAGVVLVPVAYQYSADASPAGAQLRALASKLIDAEYDHRTGRYMYHHMKTWGDPVMTSADGRYQVAFADETEIWQAPDGTGRQTTNQLEPQFPDQASQEFWQHNLKAPVATTASPASDTISLPPWDLPPLPSDRRQLSELLKVGFGAGAASKEVSTVYGRYVVPRQTRAEILRVLADVPGFLWRGDVIDRAGRKGVAITFDDRENHAQSLLIFNPNTGELLAHERLTLSPTRVSAYRVILGTDWTNQLG